MCLVRPRLTPSLSFSFTHRLSSYAVAASAAGLGALAIASSAEAKIVYTPADVAISTGETVPLDLNHDGIVDFDLVNYSNTFEGSQQGFLWVNPATRRNGVDGNIVYERALDLAAGTPVGMQASFAVASYVFMISADAAQRCFGYWNNVKNKFLGFKFSIQGETHFGWARISAACNPANNKIHAVLTGYAYETAPGKTIVAGDQGQDEDLPVPRSRTLGDLAAGTAP